MPSLLLTAIPRLACRYKTSWDKIDVEFLTEETKKLQRDIKTLNKAARNYEVYRLMEEKLKAMSTSLPLVNDLHHPAMRQRHWEQLMKVGSDPQTCLFLDVYEADVNALDRFVYVIARSFQLLPSACACAGGVDRQLVHAVSSGCRLLHG